MVCTISVHRLEGRAPAEAETGVRNQASGFGVGAIFPDGEASGWQYDIWELLSGMCFPMQFRQRKQQSQEQPENLADILNGVTKIR